MSMMWNEGKTNEEEFAERLSGGARPEGNLDNNDLSPMESISAAAIGGHSVDDLPPHYFRSPRFLVSLLSVSLAWVATLLGFVMISTSVGVLEEVFGPSTSYIWVVLNIILGQTVFFTVNGRLSDIFGRRYFFIYGSVLGFIGSIISGSAKNLNSILGANFIIGMAYGVQQIEGALFCELVPNKYRMICLAITWVTFSPLIGVGPGLGEHDRQLSENPY
ncbi:hypothetical protein H2204_004697 [Knufia peltigerae]|uniref:Major facilitator superfamily (MFS) profile domain-containing protein n=1 Tax=Knufia peltigerae TaxID=1002370 RepID=A0AA39CYA9_9EURO|nr:hypothetical protein H2204_004697 [Knufia peltigerae]